MIWIEFRAVPELTHGETFLRQQMSVIVGNQFALAKMLLSVQKRTVKPVQNPQKRGDAVGVLK